MNFAKFQENRFRIYGEIAENHAILVNLTASIESSLRLEHCWVNTPAALQAPLDDCGVGLGPSLSGCCLVLAYSLFHQNLEVAFF